MYIAILGRQSGLAMAELEHLYGDKNTRWFSDNSAVVSSDSFSVETIGGTIKAGRIVAELSHGDWRQTSMKIVQLYAKKWAAREGKVTLGLSAYGFDISPRDIQRTGIILKQKVKSNGGSLRLVPNEDAALSSATSHHNKLGLSPNKQELLIVRSQNGRITIAESVGAQNITSLARRDQGRPKRDAFVGMLPPKLAQIMINLTRDNPIIKTEATFPPRLLDPFCGTGVVLQEAALLRYAVYGTDLSEKMIDYSKVNLDWLAETYHLTLNATLEPGDAMDTKWQPPIDAVVCESYLGQPFSAPPAPEKLSQVVKNCDHIISTFLKNIGDQLPKGTPLCIAVPAWRDHNGHFTYLPLAHKLDSFGYTPHRFAHIRPDDLIYYREDQVVARHLLVMVKA